MLVVLGSSKCIKSKKCARGGPARQVDYCRPSYRLRSNNGGRSIHSPYSRPADRFYDRSCLLPWIPRRRAHAAGRYEASRW
jgi:hypothetical protein